MWGLGGGSSNSPSFNSTRVEGSIVGGTAGLPSQAELASRATGFLGKLPHLFGCHFLHMSLPGPSQVHVSMLSPKSDVFSPGRGILTSGV